MHADAVCAGAVCGCVHLHCATWVSADVAQVASMAPLPGTSAASAKGEVPPGKIGENPVSCPERQPRQPKRKARQESRGKIPYARRVSRQPRQPKRKTPAGNLGGKSRTDLQTGLNCCRELIDWNWNWNWVWVCARRICDSTVVQKRQTEEL